jgi:replicative DNA helicase Mcm
MEREKIVENFAEFVRENYYEELLKAVNENKKSLIIDFQLLDREYPELTSYLLENPEETIKACEEAITQIDTGLGEAKLRIRFNNLPEDREIRIRKIRSEHIGKMIVVDGFVRRASEIRPEVYETSFQCPQCGNVISVIQTGRVIKGPAACEVCGNKKGFKAIDQKLYDARWIVIEEPFEITTGERPSELMIYLKEDLTSPKMQNKTEPGNRIKVIGILKELPRRVKGTPSRQMEIYLDANWVEPVEIEWEEIEISEEDRKKIIELSKDPEIYEKLINSIAPSMYGMRAVKEAILLQLFGGEPHILPDGSRIRGEIHILLVGDPASGKSQLMQQVVRLVPRGKYVSGRGVTAAGLTATVTRDEEFLGGWVLDAGAVVMTNKSVLAIDEFSKVSPQDQVALQEAMSIGSISIAKASIVATLPAQTSILAGANPKLGRFDPYLPIREQVNISDVLLSRFDLKFALRDIPNPEVDAKVADHILRARHFKPEFLKPVIEPEFLRKYVAFARANCHPELTPEAGEMLKNFYLEMRQKSGEEAPIAITLRQYEALIRLAEASARVALRNKVTREDALRAINLMKVSLREFGFEPETGMFDIDRAEGQRITAVQRSKIRILLDVIDELSAIHGRDIPKDEVIKRARDEGVDNADEILQKMIREGIVFQPKPDYIQKI